MQNAGCPTRFQSCLAGSGVAYLNRSASVAAYIFERCQDFSRTPDSGFRSLRIVIFRVGDGPVKPDADCIYEV
jgi:hypothetical protein